MSKQIEEIRRKLFSPSQSTKDTVFLAVVKEVNEEEFTCQVRRDDEVDYFDVRLRGVIDPELQGAAFIPKLESKVLVCRIGGSNQLYVCQFTEIEKVILTSGELSFTLDPDQICLERADTRLLMEDGHMEFCKGEEMKFTTDGSETLLQQGDTTLTLDGGTLSINNAGKSTIDITGDKIEILSGDATVTLDGSGIHIEKGASSVEVTASNAVMKTGGSTIQTGAGGLTLAGPGASLKDIVDGILNGLMGLSVTTAMGPSGPPLNIADFIALKVQLPLCMEG